MTRAVVPRSMGVGPGYRKGRISSVLLAAVGCLVLGRAAVAQPPTSAAPPVQAGPASTDSAAVAALAAQLQELRLALDNLREQLNGSRRESAELREELQKLRDEVTSIQSTSMADQPVDAAAVGGRVETIAEEQELLSAKVADLEQSKIESGSKYHVRFSALALLNAIATRGSVDDLDLPEVAEARDPGESGGSVAAGVRQSRVSLEMFGPGLAGSRAAAALTADFFGGFSATSDGLASPLLRLRTATLTMKWKSAEILAGQDAPFFSPGSPTSLASTAYPALSGAGNLWAWTPQIRVDQPLVRWNDSMLGIQWGILDAFTGEPPTAEYSRAATAGERSRMPAEALRIAWRHGTGEHPTSLGVGAFHAAQNWGFDRRVHSWATTIDFDVPVGRLFVFAGEFYRGQSIGGLGGGASSTVVFDGPQTAPGSAVLAVHTTGGWSQVKFKPVSRIEVNAAYGEDRPLHAGLESVMAIGPVDGLNRNRSAFANTIYQVRSNIFFSIEYRRLWTTPFDRPTRTADHFSISTGVAF